MSEATREQSAELITYLDPRELVPNPRNPVPTWVTWRS
jgi:hypothetical protein